MGVKRRAFLIGGLALAGAGVFGIGWAVSAWAQPGPARQSIVTTEVKVRRGYRVKWRGAGQPPKGLTPAPKFKVGDKVTIRVPAEPGVEPDPLVEGKQVLVMELIYSERVAYGAGGAVTVLPEPGAWSYRTSLVIAEQPVEVAETSLVKA